MLHESGAQVTTEANGDIPLTLALDPEVKFYAGAVLLGTVCYLCVLCVCVVYAHVVVYISAQVRMYVCIVMYSTYVRT